MPKIEVVRDLVRTDRIKVLALGDGAKITAYMEVDANGVPSLIVEAGMDCVVRWMNGSILLPCKEKLVISPEGATDVVES